MPSSTETPPPVANLRPEAPPELARLVEAALEKDRSKRSVTSTDFVQAAAAIHDRASAERSTGAGRLGTIAARTRRCSNGSYRVVPGGFVWWRQHARIQWARDVAPLEIRKLADNEQFLEAFDTAVRAEAVIPQHPGLVELWPIISRPASIDSTPPGAEVVYRKYGDRDGEWRPLGRTPLAKVKFPRGAVEWKVALPGYTDVLDISTQSSTLRASVHPRPAAGRS